MVRVICCFSTLTRVVSDRANVAAHLAFLFKSGYMSQACSEATNQERLLTRVVSDRANVVHVAVQLATPITKHLFCTLTSVL